MTRDDEIHIFRGALVAEMNKDEEEAFISNDPDELFYQVPRKLLSFIDGCPSRMA